MHWTSYRLLVRRLAIVACSHGAIAVCSAAALGGNLSAGARGVDPRFLETEGSAASDGLWRNYPPPQGGTGFAAIFDPIRNRMIVLGGWPVDPSGCEANYWALQLSDPPQWSRIAAEGDHPPTQWNHTAVYDPQADRVLVFGGENRSALLDGLWELSLAGAPTWTRLHPMGPGPTPRSSHSAAYDPVRHRMLVYGGDIEGGVASDLWALNMTGTPAWTELHPEGIGPGGLAMHVCVYDPIRDRLLLALGKVGSTSKIDTNAAWALALADVPTWSQLAPSGSPPSPRSGASAIYDPQSDRVVVFGGAGAYFSNQTWALSLAGGSAWQLLATAGSTPTTRAHHVAVYDPAPQRMVVFGGTGDGGTPNDVRALALGGPGVWELLAPNGAPTEPLSGHTAIYDPLRERLLIFGGTTPTGRLDDLWAVSLDDPPVWTRVAALGIPPSGRSAHSAVYDPSRDRMVVFGGYGDARYDDVWSLTLSGVPTWTQLHPGGDSPAARAAHAAVYEPGQDRMVIMGGNSGNGALNDVWALNFAAPPTWSELHPSGAAPAGRSSHTAIYDPAYRRVLIFGGRAAAGLPSGELWELSLADPPGWRLLQPPGAAPQDRWGHVAMLDERRARMVMFAGYTMVYSGQMELSDLWALKLSEPVSWRQLEPSCPAPLSGGYYQASHDVPRDRMLLTGHGRNSLWALEMDGTVPVLELLLQGRCTAGGVELTWRVSSAADATGFSIRRRLLPSGEFLAPAGGDLLPPSSDRFVDPGVLPGQTYEYRVTWVGQDGVALLSRAATVAVPAAPLVVSLQSSNPSRGTATFACGVPQPSPTSLIVYDSRGRFVRQLVHAPEATGKFTVEWDGRDDSGERVPSGVYFCRLLAAGRTSTARIVIAR